MADYLTSAVCAVVIQRNRWGLVVKLQSLRVVLHLIDGGQLDTMTFKLDGHTHFSAGKKATHVGTPTPDAARRIRSTHLINDRPGRLAEIQPLIP